MSFVVYFCKQWLVGVDDLPLSIIIDCLMETNAFQRVLDALRQLVGACDNGLITSITHTLNEQMTRPGYLAILANIIRCPQLERDVIFAALTQLRNRVKMRSRKCEGGWEWGEEVRPLMECMIELNVLYCGSRQELKLLKDICQATAEELMVLGPQLHEMLLQGRELKACLNILLGIANSFLYETLSPSAPFLKMLEYTLPAVHRLIHIGEEHLTALYWTWHSNQNEQFLQAYHSERAAFEEILYMAIKLVSKSLHQHASIPLREHYCLWASIAQNRLEEQNQNYSQLARDQPHDCGKRGSDEFSYFHGKKWAAKFMSRLLTKILIVKRSLPQVSAVTTAFFKGSTQALKLTLRRVFQYDQPSPLRYFELMLLETLRSSIPNTMRSQQEHYLCEVLPRLAVLSPLDVSNLTHNPQDFLTVETLRDSPRWQAMDIWARMARSDSEKCGVRVTDLQEGEMLVIAFSLIREWLREGSGEVREVALSLMVRLDVSLFAGGRSTTIAEELISLCLPHIFHQPQLTLQLRGFQLITHYRRLIPSQTFPALQEAILHVLRERSMVSGVKMDVLAIYAGVALQKVVSFGGGGFSEEEIRLILMQLLELIKLYQVSELNETLIAMITCYPQQMNAYAVQLVRYLSDAIREVFARTLESPAAQLSESVVEITSVLATLANLRSEEGEFDVGLREILQEEVCSLLDYALSCEEQLFTEYTEGLLLALRALLNSLTNRVTVLSSRITFYFTFLVFQLAPLDGECIRNCTQSSLTPLQRNILECSTKGFLSTQLIFTLFREYLKFADPSVCLLPAGELKSALFHSDILNQWTYLMVSCYRNGRQREEQPYSLLQQRYLVTSLLICLMEHHHCDLPERLYMLIFKVIMVNHRSGRFKPHLNRKNIQLLLMWVWAYPNALSYASSQQLPLGGLILKILMKGIVQETQPLKESAVSRRRTILGLCRLIQLEPYDATLQSCNFMLMEWLFFMASANYPQDSEEDEGDDEGPRVPSVGEEEEVEPGEVVFEEGEQGLSQEEGEFATDGCRFDDEIDEEGGEGIGIYQEKRTVNELQYLLDTLLGFKTSSPEIYCSSVFPLHGWKISHFLDYCNPQLRQKYEGLILE